MVWLNITGWKKISENKNLCEVLAVLTGKLFQSYLKWNTSAMVVFHGSLLAGLDLWFLLERPDSDKRMTRFLIIGR